jgi:hypothetical protein
VVHGLYPDFPSVQVNHIALSVGLQNAMGKTKPPIPDLETLTMTMRLSDQVEGEGVDTIGSPT